MVRVLDGPARGAVLSLRRAPMYMRVVIDPHGKVDALDQVDDVPEPGETVHVYARLRGTRSQVSVRPGGCYETGDYEHMPDVEAERLRDTDAWRAWAREQPDRGE